jgi:putative redox protein
MAVEITGRHIGGLKLELRHGPSGATLRTAAPVDNAGDGSSYSPTDLLAAALGSCMLTLMAIAARRAGIPFDDAAFMLEKHMRTSPRRVEAIPVRIRMPAGLTAPQRQLLEHAALTCPVHLSLHPDVRRDVRFEYADDAPGAGGA